jgi:hypothetical protein
MRNPPGAGLGEQPRVWHAEQRSGGLRVDQRHERVLPIVAGANLLIDVDVRHDAPFGCSDAFDRDGRDEQANVTIVRQRELRRYRRSVRGASTSSTAANWRPIDARGVAHSECGQEKRPRLPGPFFIAGAGFEPATFGL